jgi:hypothetical protein
VALLARADLAYQRVCYVLIRQQASQCFYLPLKEWLGYSSLTMPLHQEQASLA